MRLLPILLVALAHLPLLMVYFQQLWGRPHYQFFPLVLAAAACFIWQRWERRTPPSRRAVLVANGLLLVSLPILGYAFLRLSPLFAYVSFLLVVASLLLRVGVPALGPWLLLWLVVRIPYGQDVALIQWMQRLTTQLSSVALERLGIEHIADGNVLLFPSTSLFVEEACSGVVSLLAIVASAGILAVWWRRSIIHAICLIGTAVFLAGAMNIVRVVTIAVALDSFDVNLAEGWRHEVLGLVIFAISLLGLLSVDRLFAFFLSPIRMNPLATYWDDAEGNALVSLWNRYVGLEEFDEDEIYDTEVEGPATPSPSAHRHFGIGMATEWVMAGLFLLIGVGQVIAGIGPFSVAPEASRLALDLNEDSLPPQWGEWTRVDFEVSERDSSSAFGEHSRIWAFQNGTTTVRVSLDFVFPEWHALTACYAGVGWDTQSQKVQDSDAGAPFVEATFAKPNGEWALLLFDLFDDDGRPYEAPSGTFVHPQLRRIMNGESSRWNLPSFYQVQALTVSNNGPVGEEQVQQTRQLFQWFRQNMVRQFGEGAAEGRGSAVRSEQTEPASRNHSTEVPGPAPNAQEPGDERTVIVISSQDQLS